MAPLISLCQLLALVVVVRSAPAPAGGGGQAQAEYRAFLNRRSRPNAGRVVSAHRAERRHADAEDAEPDGREGRDGEPVFHPHPNLLPLAKRARLGSL
eukprot:COSAG01_NODE_332_length_18712_cov_41.424358_25_plen_98_part_00